MINNTKFFNSIDCTKELKYDTQIECVFIIIQIIYLTKIKQLHDYLIELLFILQTTSFLLLSENFKVSKYSR